MKKFHAILTHTKGHKRGKISDYPAYVHKNERYSVDFKSFRISLFLKTGDIFIQ